MKHKHPKGSRSSSHEREFDGIVAFGGVDWWYHNRGHYDLRILRELSCHVPVLYVNSVGVRTPLPSEGRIFLGRVLRKLRSYLRGLVRVTPQFSVFSPVYAPLRYGQSILRTALAAQVRIAAARVGIRRPLLWAANPSAAGILGRMGEVGVVHQRTDRFEALAGIDRGRVEGQVARLLQDADLSLFCARDLQAADEGRTRRSALIEHGVDFPQFAAAGDGMRAEPAVLEGLPRPRVGFVGSLDEHTLDLALLKEVTARMPDVQFVLVGGSTIPETEFGLPNIKRVGRQELADVPAFMAACDVLMMPWNQNDWIDGCNPVKLKEYLAVGRPIVSTRFRELAHYQGLVRSGTGVDEFEMALRSALNSRHDPEPGRSRVLFESWRSKSEAVLRGLECVGLYPAKAPHRLRGVVPCAG